ncbi:Concanavalin A-like lectin/glucanase subgroup [Penicillium atrosanguineum]|nr:Concanavalin A-like lectin/glucanase subgroup [Penicillium atrosanguineum]
MKTFFNLAVLATLASNAFAQTSTLCNPLEKSCPADPALGTTHEWYFNTTLDTAIWNMTTGDYTTTDDGAEFTISKEGESTLLQSNFYIFFGVVESWVKMAKGGGVISSVVLESDDLDEIDWEWVGYNTSQVQSNFFGKGNDTTFNRGGFHAVANADTEFHNYTTYWDSDKLEWWIDGDLVRTVPYSTDSTLQGKNYPQTPCQVKISNWPAGTKNAARGTIEWAGGLVDYSKGPFTMTVQKIRIQDFHTGKEYSYGDHSGDWQSINVAEGNSTALNDINNPPKSLAEKWDDLGTGAHAGVYVGAAAAGTLVLVALGLYCVRKRRQGRLEQALGNDQYDNDRNEMQNYQNDWKASEWRTSGYHQVK